MLWGVDTKKSVLKTIAAMDLDKINMDLVESVLEWIVDGKHNYPLGKNYKLTQFRFIQHTWAVLMWSYFCVFQVQCWCFCQALLKSRCSTSSCSPTECLTTGAQPGLCLKLCVFVLLL